jgi:hypothetical protein
VLYAGVGWACLAGSGGRLTVEATSETVRVSMRTEGVSQEFFTDPLEARFFMLYTYAMCSNNSH